MNLFGNMFRGVAGPAPLYTAVVEQARAPHWYLDGAVADTIDGRFDMIAAVLSMVLLRIEAEMDAAPERARRAAAALSARLVEDFVADMEPQLREIGVGDLVVGKHIGRMMTMVEGRLDAYRHGRDSGDIRPALVRNLYRGAAPDDGAVNHVARALEALRARLSQQSMADIADGRIGA